MSAMAQPYAAGVNLQLCESEREVNETQYAGVLPLEFRYVVTYPPARS
jgi:hypothetical protein